jgi:hypothetical protein
MRDVNKIVTKLGQRVKEIDNLLGEMNHIAKTSFGEGVELDMDNLTMIGHGLGATTAVSLASKDQRIKKVLTLDPWLTPIKEEIENKTIKVTQPHCSVNSELFNVNLSNNW